MHGHLHDTLDVIIYIYVYICKSILFNGHLYFYHYDYI